MTPDAPVADRRLRSASLMALAVAAPSAAALLMGGLGIGWALLPACAAFAAGWALAAPALPEPEPPKPEPEPPQPPRSDRGLGNAMLVGSVIENFALPLIITGRDETVIAASALGRRMFPGLGVGRPISLAIRDPDFLEGVIAAAREGRDRTIILNETAPVNRSLRVHINAIRGAEGAQMSTISVFEDLSEQRATERMRVDFIANASHELRTPLASLLGFIETLQGPARDDPKARERFLGIMRDQAGRMARLIDDLLSLSRAELRAHQHPVAIIDLRSIVREIIDSLSMTARERGVMLTASLPETPMMLRGDRDDLLRLVENLVENGIRYGRDGKSVEIAVSAGPRGDIALSVRDHGPGIAAEHIPRLTERFYRADVSHSREIGGTGLGLAIVKHLVARHRARLEVESRIGDGATFRVLFPPADGASE